MVKQSCNHNIIRGFKKAVFHTVLTAKENKKPCESVALVFLDCCFVNSHNFKIPNRQTH